MHGGAGEGGVPGERMSHCFGLSPPVAMNHTSSERFSVGRVREIRSDGSFGLSVTPITARLVGSELGCAGKIEATCPSTPIPSSVMSKVVSPSSASYSAADSWESFLPSFAAIMCVSADLIDTVLASRLTACRELRAGSVAGTKRSSPHHSCSLEASSSESFARSAKISYIAFAASPPVRHRCTIGCERCSSIRRSRRRVATTVETSSASSRRTTRVYIYLPSDSATICSAAASKTSSASRRRSSSVSRSVSGRRRSATVRSGWPGTW